MVWAQGGPGLIAMCLSKLAHDYPPPTPKCKKYVPKMYYPFRHSFCEECARIAPPAVRTARAAIKACSWPCNQVVILWTSAIRTHSMSTHPIMLFWCVGTGLPRPSDYNLGVLLVQNFLKNHSFIFNCSPLDTGYMNNTSAHK